MVNIKNKISRNVVFIIFSIFILNFMMASGEGLRVFDDAELFSKVEVIQLNEEANKISKTYSMDIVIVTTNNADGKISKDYADDYFDQNGFGVGDNRNGILFLIDMDNREAYISKSGNGIKYLTDQRTENILSFVLENGIGDGDYYVATMGFLSGTKEYLESGVPSNQYSEDENVEVENSLTFMEGAISLLTGFIASVGFFLRTKSKYKMKNPVKPLTFRNNSIVNLTSKEEKLIDTTLTNRKIAKSSDSDSGKSTTHTSSSGKTHGGGGVKF